MSKGTIDVNLRRDWFGPGGTKYDAVDNPHQFPATWAEEREVLDLDDEPIKDKDGKVIKARILPKSAEIIEGGRTVVVNQNTANGERLLKPQSVDDDVKDVGGALNEKGVEEPSQSVAAAEKGAEAQNVSGVGAKPRESGPPEQSGTKKK